MREVQGTKLIRRRYREKFGAVLSPAFPEYRLVERGHDGGAALGYRRADTGNLFLEAYLDQPIEELVGAAFGKVFGRHAIIEIGNFAADNAMAMIELWSTAANDLGGAGEVAVATLTAPLRRMFARIGIPVVVLAPARAEQLAGGSEDWGNYYASDPQVCAGIIAEGQLAIARFMARRQRDIAA